MLRNIRIRTRLLTGFGLVVLFLVAVGIVSLNNLAEQRKILADFYQHPFTVTNSIREVQAQVLRMHRGVKDAVLYYGNRQELETIVKGIDESEKTAYSELAAARERFLGDKAKIDRIKELLDEWKPIRAKTIALLRQNKVQEAIAQHKTFARDQVTQIDGTIDEVLKFAVAKADSYIKEAEHNQQLTLVFTSVLIIASILLAVVTALLITASIVNPLRSAVEAAERLATGDLSTEMQSDAKDETGQLLRSMGQMILSLRRMGGTANRIAKGDLDVEVVPNSERDVFGVAMKNMVESLKRMAATADRIAAGNLAVEVTPASGKDRLGNSFATMAGNLRELNTEIREMVNLLATSAGEIMTTVSEFASSSSETASAISETNATVQEVRQTTDLTSLKAKHVYETAQKAVNVARAGMKSVDDSISGMHGIQERMGFIAERIVNLSEQSQAIGDIIATVNDLAEQSNLLAVNAAIEAAKAGEHGKGFAVVAQEVKNLATQSKQATAQVRGILGDIQKATTAAVLATEQGSKSVEAGMKQSSEAGEAIRLLSASIEESSNSTLQIVTSTQEQAIGMDQIATAIQSINQASNQNVEGSRQIETATRSIYDMNQKLKQLVSRYTVT
jgi:methyl-accepting chemotaxis protein